MGKSNPQEAFFLPTILDDRDKTLLYTIDEEKKEVLKTKSEIPPEWETGQVIDNLYEVTGILGKGGYGTVYKVYHTGWNMELAVKTMHSYLMESEKHKKNFLRECEGWINLGLHPNITTCYYVRELGDLPRIFLEYMDGGNLLDFPGGKELDLRKILNLSFQCLDGLSFAHGKGLIHQDIKPANCLLNKEGELKITDFGITCGFSGLEDSNETVIVNEKLGTPSYMPPEQWGREYGEKGPWSDIYSFGVMLYEMVCKKRPFDEGVEHIGLLKLRHINSLPLAPHKINNKIPPCLSEFILKCLKKNPKDRFTSCKDVRNSLLGIYKKITGKEYSGLIAKEVDLLADSLNNRGVSLMDLGMKDTALKTWQEALKSDPLHIASIFNRNIVKWRLGNIDDSEVIKYLEHLKSEKPESKEIDYLMGLVHLERDDCHKALESFKNSSHLSKDKSTLLKEAELKLSCSTSLRRAIYNNGFKPVEGLVLSEDLRWAFGWGLENIKIHIPSGKLERYKESNISSIAISSDGKFIATGYVNGFIKICNLITGEELNRFSNKFSLTFINISNDGSLVLTVDRYNNIHIWRVDTGECKGEFKGEKSKILSAILTPDNKKILSGHENGIFEIWEVSTGHILRRFSHENSPGAITFSKDGNTGVSIDIEGVLKIWDCKTGNLKRINKTNNIQIFKKSRTYRAHTPLSLSGDGLWLIAPGKDNNIKLLNTITGKWVRSFEGHNQKITSLAISNDGKTFLSGDNMGQVKIWKIEPSGFNRICSFFLCRIKNIKEIDKPGREYSSLINKAREKRDEGEWGKVIEILRKARRLPGFEREPQGLLLWNDLSLYSEKTGLRAIWQVNSFHLSGERFLSFIRKGKGGMIFSADEKKRLKIRDVITGESIKIFEDEENYGDISSVSMSADKKHIITGHNDGKIIIREFFGGKCLNTLKGRKSKVNSLKISFDGRLLFSAGSDNRIKVWHISSGLLLRVLEGHNSPVLKLCLCNDPEKILSVGSNDKTIKLWDLPSGKCIKNLEGHRQTILSADLSSDNRMVLSGSLDNTLRLWDLTFGKCIKVILLGEEDSSNVTLEREGRFALSGCSFFILNSKKTLKIWDLYKGEILKTLEKHESYDFLSFSKDNSLLFTGSRGGIIKIWQLDWDLRKKDTEGREDEINSFLKNFLSIHTQGKELERKSSKEDVRDYFTGKPDWKEEDLKNLIKKLHFSGYKFISKGEIKKKLTELSESKAIYNELIKNAKKSLSEKELDKSANILNKARSLHEGLEVFELWKELYPHFSKREFQSLECFNSFHTGGQPLFSCSISNDGKYFIEGSGKIRIWNFFLGTSEYISQKYSGIVKSVHISMDKEILITGYEDGKIKIWNIPDKKCLKILEGHEGPVTSLLLSNDKKKFISSGKDNLVKIWNMAGGKPVRTFKEHKDTVWKTALSDDGKMALSGGKDRVIRIWNTETGEVIRNLKGHRDTICNLILRKKIILSTDIDRIVKIWDFSSGKTIKTIELPDKYIKRVTITSDGRWLIGAGEKELALWQLSTGKFIENTNFYHKGLNAIWMTGDDGYIVSKNMTGLIKIWRLYWDLDIQEEIIT